ncbi:NAD(P)/FAD-dependent oxidoreductase [Streptomyces sp. NPDC003247]|uniref:NAD(P)/FAD-dependent oxidoreductase n=1 Tax=Streptomyces sp. NPDC003247 TaxID=3364677 RepID=UPI00367CBCCC
MSGRPERIVVVGNGIAGVTAADGLRGAGFDGELTIIGDERHAAYSRPALSKALLAPASDLSAHRLPAPTHGATEILGVPATGLDVAGHRVTLADGSAQPYDALVVATGSRARRLTGSPHELTLRGFDDAVALRERIAVGRSVLVVGGGPLGMEIASNCVAAGCAVTLVSQGAPLVEQIGAHLAGVFTAAARERGVRIVDSGAVSVEHDGDRARVVAGDGAVHEAEVLVSAVGDIPNVEWMSGTGLVTHGALHVDERGMLGRDIAAVGDVAAFPTTRGVRRIPLWSSAIEQAKVAAVALMSGADAPPLAFEPYFWTEAFGLTLKAVGDLPVAGEPEYVDGGPLGPALMRWAGVDGAGSAVALDYRIPIPRLRRVCATAGA